jgi:uncharacterized protein
MPLLYHLENRHFALARWIDDFVSTIQSGYNWSLPKEPKLVREAVHGYQLLQPHEVAVLDSPLVQRLRGIHQTALAYYVYPTATHTRLDHALGVMRMAQRMMEGLVDSERNPDLGRAPLQRTRLAALLHDTGHMLFSHLSESILKDVFASEFQEAKEAGGELFEDKSFGEVISYLMITSPAFASGMDDMLQSAGLFDVSSTRIAPLVLGKSVDSGQQFEADMISGPFNADKLDYLLRDCHFSGIRASVDVERVYYTVRLLDKAGEPRSLAMHSSGVPNLEQILFAKMILYSSVYHHHKVRALECMFRGIVERLQQHQTSIKHAALRLNTLADWLHLSEQKLLVLGVEEDCLSDSIRQLMNRKLLKRALVLSLDTVMESSKDGILRIYADADYADIRGLRQAVYEKMPKSRRGDISDLWVDVPNPPTVIKDVVQVRVTSDKKSHYPLSSERFQWDKWTNNYGEVKWKAHVFAADNDVVRRDAGTAAIQVLRKRYGIRLSEEAIRQAKLE